MCRIRFEPSGNCVEISGDETILAAADRAGVLIVAPCGGRGVCRKCMVTVNGEQVLSCLHRPAGDAVVAVPHLQPATDASERRAQDYILNALHEASLQADGLLAIDLGTTGVAVAWIAGVGGEVRYGKARNRQAMHGADVLSRIMMTEEEGAAGRAKMQRLARESIAAAVARLGNIPAAQSVVISANPTMAYLLLGMDAASLRKGDTQPQMQFDPMPASELMGDITAISRNAIAHILPGVANYLGGDVIAGVALARRFHPSDRNFLFIDAGTNGEIVLCADDAILGIATSAGPAFEGGEVSAGISAVPGAIDTIRITPGEFWGEYGTIGDLPPAGICGSGIIELVAELNRTGALERNGRISSEMLRDAFADDEFGRRYVLVPAAATANGQDIAITDSDLGAIINTKAAIYAGCRRLIHAMGMEFGDLDRIFIAGDFGYHINIGAAINIGMLPDLRPDRYIFLGNASLAGAAISGILPEFAQEMENITRQTAFLDLGEDLEFIDEYMAARFLPHTNANLFPSLKQPPTG